MAVQQINHIREGAEWIETTGTNDATGNAVHHWEDPEVFPKTGMPYKWVPGRQEIVRNDEGGVGYLRTEFIRKAYGIDGVELPEYRLSVWRNTNDADLINFFIPGMGKQILASEFNLFVKAYLEHDTLPGWDTMVNPPVPIVYDAVKQNQAPTGNYYPMEETSNPV